MAFSLRNFLADDKISYHYFLLHYDYNSIEKELLWEM